MNCKVSILCPITYEVTNKEYICLKTPHGDHITNLSGRIILDSLYDGVLLKDIVEKYQNKKSISFRDAAVEVCEYLGGLKTLGFLEYDDGFFDDVIFHKQFNVAGEREYQKISDAIIKNLNTSYTLLSRYPNQKHYDAFLLRSKGFAHKELYFYSDKKGIIQSIIGLSDLSTWSIPANLVLVQTKDEGNLTQLYEFVEKELKRLKKYKIRAVFPQDNGLRLSHFLNSVGFFQEAELIKEDGTNNYLIMSKIITENNI